MPSFAPDPNDPKAGPLSPSDVALIADWIRGDWYKPEGRSVVPVEGIATPVAASQDAIAEEASEGS